MAKTKSGLGRGLGAIISESVQSAEADIPVTVLPLQKVEPNPLQPRKNFDPEALQALVDSIAEHGIIQPLSVRKVGEYYQIVAGERRWRAARLAGLTEVPVCVLDIDDRETMELALVENLQREDLNPIEEAEGYRTLMDEYGLTQEQAAEKVGRSRPAVANALRLLALDEELTGLVKNGNLSAGHARALLSLPSDKQRKAAAQRVMALQLSVRQTETLCKNMLKAPEKEKKQAAFGVDYIAECERNLSRQLGRKVRIVSGKRKGHFELEYYGAEDLNTLLFALSKLDAKPKEEHKK